MLCCTAVLALLPQHLYTSALALLYSCCCSTIRVVSPLALLYVLSLLLLYYTSCLALSVACLFSFSTTSVLLLYYTSAIALLYLCSTIYPSYLPTLRATTLHCYFFYTYFFLFFYSFFCDSFLVYVSSAGYFMGDGLAVLFRCVDASNAVAASPPPIPHGVADSGGVSPAAPAPPPAAPAAPLPPYSSCSSSATLLLLLLLLSLSLSLSRSLSLYT